MSSLPASCRLLNDESVLHRRENNKNSRGNGFTAMCYADSL